METLNSLPKDLESTYDQIVDRIDRREMPAATVILQWLVLGMSPLTLKELAIVVTFDKSSCNFDSSLGLAHPNDVVQLCSSLVIQAADDTVQLAHASVKEYFLRKPRKIALSDIGLGHTAIAHCCLKYLLHIGWHKALLHPKFPLFKYSAKFWPNHYKLSNKNATLQENVTAFLQAKHGLLDAWMDECYGWIQKEDIQDYYGHEPLNHAALLGLEEIVQRLMTTNQWLGTYGKAVQAAASTGHIGIVRVLLDKGADVEQVGPHGHALQTASYQGNLEIVRLLLDKGVLVDVNAPGGIHGNALQCALFSGNVELTMLLLDKGVLDVNAQGGYHGNALQIAAFQGCPEITILLLDKGADVNAKGGIDGNALQAAVCGGHTDIARLLLDKGANVNAQGGRYDSALQAAASRGHIEIARLLLDKGADVKTQGGHYGNALQAALIGGDIQDHIIKITGFYYQTEQMGMDRGLATMHCCKQLLKVILK